MCGIVGIAANKTQVPAEVLERATQSLAHRGPDDSGTIIIRNAGPSNVEVGLGNRRLAILDLSPLAHQPMHDPATGNWIAYNGEIYNFRDVRKELEDLGAQFVSSSDTEVLLRAYAQWGADCLYKLRGMFALAIWDARQHLLFLARDPMGIKPLYYAQRGAYFLFASEVRTLLGTGLVSRRLDPSGLSNYLTFGSAYDPLTLIEGVEALPPGHTLIWQNGEIKQSRYWDFIDEEGTESKPLGQACGSGECNDGIDSLQASLHEVIRMQLVSDVPVGVFLSGGIDSSALVSILSRAGKSPSTFSVVFRESEYSEAEFSRRVAREFHTDHHEIVVSQKDVLDAIPAAICAMDLPSMDAVNTYFVSRETRAAGVKVALSGLGGDELFAGYSNFHTVPRMERFLSYWREVPQSLHGPAAALLQALTPANGRNNKFASLMRSNGRLVHPYFLTRMLFTPEQSDALLRVHEPRTIERALASQRQSLCRAAGLDPVNRVSYLESRCYMLNTLLRDADFMSMSQGLELRVPLIDHMLAKRVMKIPGGRKLGDDPKPLLLAAVGEPLPKEIVHRPKRGFTLPFERWMRDELRPTIERTLDPRHIYEGPLGEFVDGNAVRNIWGNFLDRKISWSRPWSLFVLQRWCEQNL